MADYVKASDCYDSAGDMLAKRLVHGGYIVLSSDRGQMALPLLA
jgi:hypothetical protein